MYEIMRGLRRIFLRITQHRGLKNPRVSGWKILTKEDGCRRILFVDLKQVGIVDGSTTGNEAIMF
jgi:hypothetical protein